MEFKTWRDPYDAGFSTTKPTKVDIRPGLTVLVGCNGAGKTTLLQNIESELKAQKVPVHMYNNLRESSNSISAAMFYGDMDLMTNLVCSSEGEAIKVNLGSTSGLFRGFLQNGFLDSKENQFSRLFSSDNTLPITKDRFLLFDAVDSGLSVDAVVEIKDMFDAMLNDAKGMDINLYIVIAANEYELARNEECFDVVTGKYITFTDYEDYRTFIINSREKKEIRIKKQMEWIKKQNEKEKAKLKKREDTYRPKIIAIKDKAEKEKRDLTYQERAKIEKYERIIKTGESW